MQFSFLIIAGVFIVLNVIIKKKAAERKKAEEEARRAAAMKAAESRPAPQQQRPAYTPVQPRVNTQPYMPQQTAQPRTQQPYAPQQQRPQPAPQPRPAYAPQQRPAYAPQAQPPRDPRFFDDAPQPQPVYRGRPVPQDVEGQAVYAPVQVTSDDHIVRPLTESAHAHMETSATGIQECGPDDGEHTADGAAAPPRPHVKLALDKDSLAAAVIYTEILGKPRALARR